MSLTVLTDYFGNSAELSNDILTIDLNAILGDVPDDIKASSIVSALLLHWFQQTKDLETDPTQGIVITKSNETLRTFPDGSLRSQNFILQLRRPDVSNSIQFNEVL